MAGEPDNQPVPASSWYALSILFVVYFFNFVDRQILSILANDIKADLGIDDADLGFLYGTAFAIFYALFGIPFGRLADRVSRVRLLSVGLALWSAMTVFSGFAKGLGQLTLARIGVGVGEATANPCAYSLISDWFPARLRARAISLYSAGLFVGSGVSLWFGGFVVESWATAFPSNPPLGLAGWQVAFLAVGLPGLLLAGWVFALKEPGQQRSVKASQANGLFWRECLKILPPLTFLAAAKRGRRVLFKNVMVAAVFGAIAWLLAIGTGSAGQFPLIALGFYALLSWVHFLKLDDPDAFTMTAGNRAFMAIVLVYSFTSFVGYTITYWAAPFAERSFAIGKADLGLMIGAPNALGGILGVLLGGWAADILARRFASGRVLVASAAVILPVPLVLIGYSSSSLPLFLICNFFAQMVTASALGACAAASQSLVPAKMRGTSAAVFLLGPTMIGLAFGPFTAGYVSELSGSLAMGVITCLLAAIPALAALIVAVSSYPTALKRVSAG